MPRRTIVSEPGSFYHIFNRGNNHQIIFHEQENYAHFLRALHHHILHTAEIVAYVLMPNHYHLLVKLVTGDLSVAMHNLGVSYSKAINRWTGQTGAVFEGRYKSIAVNTDEYLTHMSRYIHLNPVRAKLVKHPDEWVFSSYRDYIGLRDGRLPSPDKVLELFASRAEYQAFVESCAIDDELIKDMMID